MIENHGVESMLMKRPWLNLC